MEKIRPHLREFYSDLQHPEHAIIGKAMTDPVKGNIITFVENPTHAFTPDFPGVPRVDVLKKMQLYKDMAETALTIAHARFKADFLPPNQLSPAVREIYRMFNLLKERERDKRMKNLWEMLRDLSCLFLYEDGSYRGRFQFLIENTDIEKLKLTKDEKHWLNTRKDFDAAKH